MPRLQYQTVRESDFGAGIDQQSAENRLQPGFCEDLRNADPKPTGHIAKRTGYQGYAGHLPVRVKELIYTDDSTDNIEIRFDASVQIPIGQSQPLVILGKTSAANVNDTGDFPSSSDAIVYYDSYTADARKTIATGSSTVSIGASEHGIATKYMFVGMTESTSEVANNNTHFIPDSVDIDGANFQIDIDITNGTGSTFEAFFYYLDKTADAGTVYHSLTNNIPSGSTTTVSIPAATHGLSNNNILVKAFINTAGNLTEIVPDAVRLDDSSGDVEVDINNDTGGAFDVDIILSAAPTANFSTGSVAANSSQSITIDTSAASATDFAFVSCYLETPPSTTLEQVVPDSIVADPDAQTITVTFTNNNPSGANFEIYWEFAEVSTNSLILDGTVIGAGDVFTDSEPQLTVWGLCHSDIYGTRTAREGWTNHIDSYRSTDEQRLISGLGGNLYAARLRSEGTNSSDYLLPLLYPRLNARLLADTIVGPAFYDTGETPARTRGFITGDEGGNNYFTIDSVAYNSGTGYVDYTLSVPSMVISGTLSTIISTATGLEDYFTVQQCGYSVHNGTFKIKAIASGVDQLIVSVENSSVDAADFDESDVGGLGGVFTDQLTFSTTSPFLTGDGIDSDLFDETLSLSCVNTVAAVSVIDGLTETVSVPGGLRVIGTRTSYIMPLRDANNNATVENVVRGDMLSYTGVNRQFRVLSVNSRADASISITGDGTTATVTLGSGDTSNLFVGKKILVTGTTSYNGTQIVTGLTSTTAFTFASTASTTESGTLTGKVIEIDEEFTFTGVIRLENEVQVHSRWIPIEIPEDSFDITPKTRVTHFDTNTYDSQAILRSTMVNDNLYLTNNDDEVMKFDGTNIYRAGLFRWQPNLFITTDTTATGKVTMGNPSAAQTQDSVENRFSVATSDRDVFQVGNLIEDSEDGEVYTIIAITDDSPHAHIVVDRVITGGTNGQTLTRVRSFSYYFRLNAVDANQNIVASAVTGSNDFVVELSEDAAVRIRLVGLPVWDVYDYDRLEVQIYRTKADEAAPFYRLTTIAMNFDNDGGYIDYTDTDSDDDLRDLDEVNTALKGAELGTAWTQPLRAKYCTSAGNRLILGNVKDYPTLDLRILKNSNILAQSVFTDADNSTWLFRKDNTDAGTSTNMLDRAKYEFVAVSGASTVSGITGTAGTSFSVNVTGHGLTAGDWVYLFHTAAADGDLLTYAGWWMVNSVTDADNFVILHNGAGSGAAANFPNGMLTASTSTDIPVPIGTDGNYGQLNGNRTTSEPYEFLAIKRLAEAINVSMRKVDTTVSGYSAFSPWMTAGAGNEFNTGQLIIKQPKIFDTSLEVQLPALSGDFDVFANNIKRTGASSAGAITRVFPSRILASYQNYPEIFDAPTATIDAESDSAIDVNSADGQEITAIIPFFGDSAFGAAQKSGIVVVFKTNSIYLVDLSAKDRGENPVQKLETRGKGCTAPYSVSVTRGGIMFANNTGIYRLNRDLTVDFIGRKYDRKFNTQVNKAQLGIATGHHDTQANAYKLSYVSSGDVENSQVAVYNHTREYEGNGMGSWTTYDNHPATGWANLDADSYFASTDGRVFIIRRLGETSDYRDDAAAIAMSVLTRAIDVLDSGRRKVFGKIISHYRVPAASSGTTLKTALDLKTVFQDTDAFNITVGNGESLGDAGSRKVVTISSSLDEKVGVYIQLLYENSTVDEPVELTGVDFRVAGKDSEGITEAAET